MASDGISPEETQVGSSFTDKAAQKAHQTVDRIAERGAGYEERIRGSQRRATERSHELADNVNSYVQTHPFTSLGIAAAAGFVLASLIRR